MFFLNSAYTTLYSFYINIYFLFRLHCPNQSIDEYIQHNGEIYSKGIDMKYVIQSYFGPHHFQEGITHSLFNIEKLCLYLENWKKRFSRYMNHEVVFGKCGIHPLFSHHYNFDMELRLRKAISNVKIVAIGEIGLDYYR